MQTTPSQNHEEAAGDVRRLRLEKQGECFAFRCEQGGERQLLSGLVEMVRDPAHFDVILATNAFGDILSDIGAGLAAGLGLASSGCIGDQWAYFEPVHGTAPDIAGKGIANPCATILSTAMMVRHLGETSYADAIEGAVYEVLTGGEVRTGDLGGSATSAEMTDAIIAASRRLFWMYCARAVLRCRRAGFVSRQRSACIKLGAMASPATIDALMDS